MNPPSVRKSEMSVTLKSSTSLKNCVVLYNFHEEKCSCYDLYRALTIANTELDFCKIWSPLTLFIAILMILTKYLFNSSVRLAEQFVTVGSVTLRFSVHVFVFIWMYVCMHAGGRKGMFRGCYCIPRFWGLCMYYIYWGPVNCGMHPYF